MNVVVASFPVKARTKERKREAHGDNGGHDPLSHHVVKRLHTQYSHAPPRHHQPRRRIPPDLTRPHGSAPELLALLHNECHCPSAPLRPPPPPPRPPIHRPPRPLSPSMARPGSHRARRPSPPVIPDPQAAAATPPRPGSASRRRAARRVRVQSPSLAAARRGPAPLTPTPPQPPPDTPPVRWPLDAGDAGPRSASRPGAALSVREIAAALWRMQPPQAPPLGPGRARLRDEVSIALRSL